MIRLLVLLVAMAAGTAQADLPALYRVTGVAQADTLNVRAAPGTSGAVIGTLAPDADGVEVTALSPDGKWAQVNTGEASGWAALRFLQRVSGTPFPLRATCFGTEPFWSLELGEEAVFDQMSGVEFRFDRAADLRSANRTDRTAILADGPLGRLTGTVSAQACSDGMSDRAYGLSIDAVLDFRTGGPRLISGCCTLQSR